MRDIDIRHALMVRVHQQHRREKHTRIVEELSLCQGEARVDVAVINGKLHGYEIKSERDTLARLVGQAHVYNSALDKVTIVVAGNHADKAAAAIPEWWGILLATATAGGVTFTCLRQSPDNPTVNTYAQAQLLWRDEALEELASRALDVGIKSKAKKELWERLASTLPPKEVRAIVRERLKTRKGWRAGPPQG